MTQRNRSSLLNGKEKLMVGEILLFLRLNATISLFKCYELNAIKLNFSPCHLVVNIYLLSGSVSLLLNAN